MVVITLRNPMSKINDNIEVIGAREHNLKNFDLSIPKNQLVVFTGVSGSGKSSLAFLPKLPGGGLPTNRSRAHANPAMAAVAVPGSDEYAAHQDKSNSNSKRSAGLPLFNRLCCFIFREFGR